MNINGLHVTHGVNYNIDYNLSEVYRNNSNCELLEPVKWLQHKTTQVAINAFYGDLNGIIRTPTAIHPVIYVRSRILWLMYLKYCLGSIDEQLDYEISMYESLPKGVNQ